MWNARRTSNPARRYTVGAPLLFSLSICSDTRSSPSPAATSNACASSDEGFGFHEVFHSLATTAFVVQYLALSIATYSRR